MPERSGPGWPTPSATRSLEIAYWLPERNGYVDNMGDAAVLPPVGSGKAVTVIEQQSERIGALVHDASVLNDPALIDAVASAARIALSNIRMQADVRHHVAELEASRRRILEARDAQRRRLQQELRSGVGQRLEGVREVLEHALAAAGSLDREVTSRLEDAERELHEAQVELQELAAGVHPAVLTERGLMAALAPLARRTPGDVRLTAPPQRLPVSIETAFYFVCSEALANVGKYARASHVDVEVRAADGRVTLLIADDGVGGANPTAGSGLEGAADRIEALGGRLLLESPPGMGTRLLAEIPPSRSRRERCTYPETCRQGFTTIPVGSHRPSDTFGEQSGASPPSFSNVSVPRYTLQLYLQISCPWLPVPAWFAATKNVTESPVTAYVPFKAHSS